MPADCVIALVHAVKLRQKELRDHTKVKVFSILGLKIQAYFSWNPVSGQFEIKHGKKLLMN